MKRAVTFMLALALLLCLLPATAAFADNNYDILADCDILRTGYTGDAVKRLQKALIELDYLPAGAADGAYGAKTEAAVKEFQRRNGFAGEVGFAGTATMFTQAILFGDDAEADWGRYIRENDGTGEYGVRNCELNYTTALEPSFTFVNYDDKAVSAICIYYWLADDDNNLVTIQGSDYWQQWYYDMDVEYNQTVDISITLDPTSKELSKACTLRCIVGEIAYENGAVYVTFNASKPPYNTANYILGTW